MGYDWYGEYQNFLEKDWVTWQGDQKENHKYEEFIGEAYCSPPLALQFCPSYPAFYSYHVLPLHTDSPWFLTSFCKLKIYLFSIFFSQSRCVFSIPAEPFVPVVSRLVVRYCSSIPIEMATSG